jgi:hypothetical protein
VTDLAKLKREKEALLKIIGQLIVDQKLEKKSGIFKGRKSGKHNLSKKVLDNLFDLGKKR